MVVAAPPIGGNNAAMTSEERWSKFRRTVSEGRRRMAGSTMYTLLGGAASVTVLGCFEGALYIKPKSTVATKLTTYQKLLFVGRYSLAQIIPSVIHATQPSTLIAQITGLPVDRFYVTPCQASPQRHLMLNRIKAVRGALASTVILAQVLAIMEVLGNVRKDYVERIRMGREPPLADPNRQGVVIRLAGEASFMSNLTMAREGRRYFFPIFENPQHPDVKSMVNDHAAALPTPKSRSKIGTQTVRVPVYWRVRDGAYSHKASWTGMVVPRSWLFTLPPSTTTADSNKGKGSNNKGKQQKQQRRLLILEADATSGDRTAMCLNKGRVENFDLDLYEVAQGFTQLQSMVEDQSDAADKKKNKNNKPGFETLRILLVDPQAIYTSGGGRQQTVRMHAEELGLADVIVDARKPLVYSMTTWLENAEHKHDHDRKKDKSKAKKRTTIGFLWNKPVVLETPRRDWFLSIQEEMRNHGYEIMDRADALDQFGSLEGIPFFVYERTTADTLNTVKQYVASGRTKPAQMCALCPRPWSLEAIMDSHVEGVTYISSSDIHDRLMRWVRHEALQGKTAAVIQEELDTQLTDILQQAMTLPKFTNRQYTQPVQARKTSNTEKK